MQVSILGCGWLGIPLAQSLLVKGYAIKGSTTSPAKLEILDTAGIKPFLVSLNADSVTGDITGFLNSSNILIIDIPPRLRGAESESFTDKIKTLISYIEQSGIKQVLFISSISVYGNNDGIITEDIIAIPDSDSGKQLLEAEALLQNNPNFKTTSLRFAGLIGSDRHPVYHLAGKESLPNPNAAINLIQQKDCIGIIEKIIGKNAWGEIFNAAAPFHPTRKEYYTKKAVELKLPQPQFSNEEGDMGKIISSDKISELLEYNFISDELS
jgi:hypothetical protein